MSHPLVRLSKLMNWDEIERSFGEHFTSGRGRPALHPRLVAGLQYLQHANDASDARARGRVHLQGQGTHALRVRSEGDDRDDVEGRLGGGHTQHGGHSVGWAHAGQVSVLAQHQPSAAIDDKGYQAVTVKGVQILRCGQRRGVTRTMKAMIAELRRLRMPYPQLAA